MTAFETGKMLGNIFNSMFGSSQKEPVVSSSVPQQAAVIDAGPFAPIVDVAEAFSYVTVEYDGRTISLGMSTNTIQESKFAVEELDLLKKTIQSVKKEFTLKITEYRGAHADRVANRGVMMPGGGKFGTVMRYLERSSRASQRGDVSSTIKSVKDNVIKPLDQLLLTCDKLKLVLKKEIMSGVVG